MAITGPYEKRVGANNLPVGFSGNVPYKYRWWYNQTRPYINPLPNRTQKSAYYIEPNKYGELAGFIVYTCNDSFTVDPSQPEYAQAYDRFVGKVKPRIQMALNALEAGKSFAMIASRLIQGLRLCKSFLSEIASIVSSRRRRKRLASAWLEFTFGWKPIVSDIYGAIELLSQEFPSTVLVSGGSSDSTITIPTDQWGGRNTLKQRYYRSYRLRSQIVFSNPNLALASSLGITNPLAVAWDIIPFSFVADWFFKVNTWLNSFDAMAGVSLVRPSISKLTKGDWTWSGGLYSSYGSASARARIPGGFPLPSLTSRWQIPAPSLWLAITSSALLTQKMHVLQKAFR